MPCYGRKCYSGEAPLATVDMRNFNAKCFNNTTYDTPNASWHAIGYRGIRLARAVQIPIIR